MNNPQLPPVDAPVGEIARYIAELMRLHTSVHDAVLNAVHSMHPLDLHTLKFLRARFKEPRMRHQHPKGPDFEQGEAYILARIDEVLASAIEQAGGKAVRPEPEPEIPWNDLPEWVQWVAMYSDKRWFGYDKKPLQLTADRVWIMTMASDRSSVVVHIPFTAPDWRTSLRQRPKPNDQ